MLISDLKYLQVTQEASQNQLQKSSPEGLLQPDSVKVDGLKPTRIDIFGPGMGTISNKLKKNPEVKSEESSGLSSADSLLLNLKGQNQPYTNWNYNLKPYFDAFSENAFSLPQTGIYQPLKELTDSSFIFTDSIGLNTCLKNDSLAMHKGYHTGQKEVPSTEISKEKSLPLQDPWFVILLTISLLVVGFIRINWWGYLSNVVQSILFQNSMGKLEGNNASNFTPSFILGFLFYYNSSIFIYEIFSLSERNFLGFGSYFIILLVFVALLVLFTLKIATYKFVGHIFETSDQINDYLFGASTMSKAYGILLLPVIIFIPFVNQVLQPFFIKAGLGIFVLLYLIQLGRGFRIILSNTYSVYYIILYLCALEILPLTILFKIILRN